MNEIPMYGGQHNPSVQRNPDLSRDAAQRGWKAYYQGDLNTAIKRFNQAWMFDRENYEVYWGFGLIMGRRASQEAPETSLKESIRFLQIANGKNPKNGRIIGDLAFSHTLLGYYYKSEQKKNKEAEEQFEKAGKLFADAFMADPKYPPTVANWSVFYFYTGDFIKAKSKAEDAVKMGYKFSPDYINDLEKHIK
ncbi:MAG: hypothetical protein WC440_05475 [Candidatus Omnitrophota bacterium]|jgi:tetratricopeptide (TPR) repeat protein